MHTSVIFVLLLFQTKIEAVPTQLQPPHLLQILQHIVQSFHDESMEILHPNYVILLLYQVLWIFYRCFFRVNGRYARTNCFLRRLVLARVYRLRLLLSCRLRLLVVPIVLGVCRCKNSEKLVHEKIIPYRRRIVCLTLLNA